MKNIIKKLYNIIWYIYCLLKGVNIWKNVKFLWLPYIKNKWSINIWDNVILNSHKNSYHAQMNNWVKLVSKSKDSQIIIWDNSEINWCCISAKWKIEIWKYVLIAANTSIIDSNWHDIINRQIEDCPKNINIWNNVWIGLNSVILKWTTIWENSIISAWCIIKWNINSNLIIKNNEYIKDNIL